MRVVRFVCVTCGVERDSGRPHADGCAGKYLPHWKPIIKEIHK